MKRAILLALIAAVLACLGLGRLMVAWRDQISRDALPSDEWMEVKGPLDVDFGVDTTPLPLAGRQQCFGFQDATCTVLLHYTAAGAQRVLEHNHLTLTDLHPAITVPEVKRFFGSSPVRSATVEGMTPLVLNERHHAERSLHWLELEDGTVVLLVGYLEL